MASLRSEVSDTERDVRFKYRRPYFLNFKSTGKIWASADHASRPVVIPDDSSLLPWNSGYAEVVNAGKSTWNQDQAYAERRELHRLSDKTVTLPYVYFALFDGHAGYGTPVTAANQLHDILHARLMDVVNELIPDVSDYVERGSNGGMSLWFPDNNVTKEELIRGALELAFREMDNRIEEDKSKFKMKGGCTALVALFVLGKLFVANAGDSRAVLSLKNKPVVMSTDFTAESERARVRLLAALKPTLLGNDFTTMEFTRRPRLKDLGKKVLYRDHFMDGWAYKIVTKDDLKCPVVFGEGKRSRVLGTIGVTRGFGDHDLRALGCDLPVKPFLSSQPEVRVFDFEDEDVTDLDVLIMGTDGLWDVTSNDEAVESVRQILEHHNADMRFKYILAAEMLVKKSRGELVSNSWTTHDGKPGSIDDISVFVVPLMPYKIEYNEWVASDRARAVAETDFRVASGDTSAETTEKPLTQNVK